MNTEFVVTERESYVLSKLHDRCNKVTHGKTPNTKLVKSIVVMCSSWNFPVIFEDDDPKEISDVCKSLLKKGLVKQFDDNGYPSFVPISETNIVEYKYREFSQSDVS